jgi:hypothetical protein
MSHLRRSTLNISEFKEYIRDKNILVVGNNLTAVEREQGELIDSYDVVIRFGKGLPTGREKYLGSRTDVWVTGIFRKDMAHLVPKESIILYNNSVYFPEKASTPSYGFLSMYTLNEINEINSIYNQSKSKRLSSGAITAHWLYNEINTFKSITFINFDFFQQTTLYYDKKQDTKNAASSWHLPIAVKKYMDLERPEVHPAHNPAAEKEVFQDILHDKRAHFIGESIDTARIIEADNLAWDSIRVKL